ncbi:unnamed protein product [Haemonchus placei]|uniref:Uncharacterized protein n=1 Tax=Haemonchus placei TaxID=6290 RepID=A0A0N4XC38_HAEPC|nr:unnamed protein product [Haemonchus placei]
MHGCRVSYISDLILYEMCVHKKKGKGAAGKSKRAGTGKSKEKTKKAGSDTLKDSKSDQQPVGAAGAAPEKDDDQNMMAKPCSDDVLKKGEWKYHSKEFA